MNTITRSILTQVSPLLIVIVVVGIVLGTTPAKVVSATTTFVVTKTADTNDGICDADCSLREAIIAANATPGDDIITLPSGTYTLTIAGTGEDFAATGDLDIASNLTINGANATATIVSGGKIDRVFHVTGAFTVTFVSLTISGGDYFVPDARGKGGGIFNAGGTLTLTGVTVENNTAFLGGGIYNLNGTLMISKSTIANNLGVNGGGITNDSGTLTILNSTVSGNCAEGGGVGIYTFGTTNLNNVTITNNTSTSPSISGGGIAGSANIKNTIIAGNTADSGSDCQGTLNSQGYNLIQNTNGCTISGDLTGNITGQTANLGPLQNNGGSTLTHALLTGSPAIDAGNPAAPGSGGNACEATDQRGISRPQGASCDMGAYEVADPTAFDCSYVTEIPQTECEALVALYKSTDGDNWVDNTDWLMTYMPCSWYGVTCAAGSVTMLDMSGYWVGNNLSGTIPSEIGNLTGLTTLDLAHNKLNGSIPAEIGNLTALTRLDLLHNNLSGSIPVEIGNLTALTSLDLEFNRLSGPIPTVLGDLNELRYLNLGANQLSGAIPPEICNLTALETLLLWADGLSGPIPSEIGNLTALKTLYLYGNGLTGSIPTTTGQLTNLRYLLLHYNRLSGNIPPEIGNLTALQSLYLDHNQLSGNVPSEIGNLSALLTLRLDSNLLIGELPSGITALTRLNRFAFDNTDLCVPATSKMHAWLGGITTLYSTGLICGEEPGRLGGLVTLSTAVPVSGVQVDLYRSVMDSPYWQPISTTDTIADGTFQFGNLGQGIGIDYRVRFVDPKFDFATQYYNAKPTIKTATAITITPGVPREGINAILTLPQPPMVSVETETGSVAYSPDGVAQITMPAPHLSNITVTRTVTCTAGTPTTVTLKLSTGLQYPMTNVSDALYRAIIQTADLNNATISIAATCGVITTETIVGYITLYDPSGLITDTDTGKPVRGATVTLYQVPGWLPKTGPEDTRLTTCESNLSKPVGTPWSQPAPTNLGVIVNPEITIMAPKVPYQQTTADGYYGWNVPRGCWYVTVEADGYKPLVSPVVGIPPAVTDLNLMLTPTVRFKIYLPLVLRN